MDPRKNKKKKDELWDDEDEEDPWASGRDHDDYDNQREDYY